MARYLFPILIVAAVGYPLWQVFKPYPGAPISTNLIALKNQIQDGLQPTETSGPDAIPISVYSQAAYPNVANPSMSNYPTTFPQAPSSATYLPHSNGTASPFLIGAAVNSNGQLGPVVSNEAFAAMGGETYVFPGTATAPDLTASPMEFAPVNNLGEILRFDIFPNWVKSRWKRVSTSPGEFGLHGLRVALVTGTNRSDLHGSLTYYFDANQRVQRITFRGWTGDSNPLMQLLTQTYGFKAQQTHLAGLYAAQRPNGTVSGGIVMKHPPVIRADQPAHQIAMDLEINNPRGPYNISSAFESSVLEARKLH